MELTTAIKKSIDTSVLCWLATVSENQMPNVSPKEIFTHYREEYIIVANIASPQTVRNIKQNPQVCISFIDILVQKGYQLKGTAEIIKKTDSQFLEMEAALITMTGGKYPFASITKIAIDLMKPIIAPSYTHFPETTEEEHIATARKVYELF